MKGIKRIGISIALLSALLLGSVYAAGDLRTVDVYEISETAIEPRWTYMNRIENGLVVDEYEVVVTASTIAYGNNHAYVTAVLQQKQANGSYEDYAEFSSDNVAGAAVSERITVPYGTYRIVSYHSAGNGTNMEYKSLVGPDKRVPHDTVK